MTLVSLNSSPDTLYTYNIRGNTVARLDYIIKYQCAKGNTKEKVLPHTCR